jgi:monovalent cation:H+ antiporter-2, CPA2 family
MEYEFLKSLEVIFISSAAVILLLYKLKMPSLIGFIVAGVIIGPHGVELIEDIHDFILFTGDRENMNTALEFFQGRL